MSPTRPRRFCSCRGCRACAGRCPETTTGGKCDGCKGEVKRTPEQIDRKKIYNSARWKALRRRVLREQPWCAEPGCTELSHDVHHIIELDDDITLAYVRSNVEGRCHPHHSKETAKAKLHRG